MKRGRRKSSQNLKINETTSTLQRGIVLAPDFDKFGACERASWHSSMLNRLVTPISSMITADSMCKRGEPCLIRSLSSGDDRKSSILMPPSEHKGTEIWFIHKRHRVVFVIDTSPSMRTLRASNKTAPLGQVGSALIDFCLGLAMPMGSLHQEVFISVVAHVHTKSQQPNNSNDSNNVKEPIGRDSVVELVQGFLLSGHDTEEAIASAAKLGEEVIKELGKLEEVLWTMIKPSLVSSSISHDGTSTTSKTTKKKRKSIPGVGSHSIHSKSEVSSKYSSRYSSAPRAILCAPPSSLEPMIEAGVFALKWLPLDGLPSIVLVTDGVSRDKQLLTTYDGMIMQLCRRDIVLSVLQLGVEASDGAAAAFGMVSDNDTIGRLCEMTGGSLFNPKLLKTLIRLPATILSESSQGSTNGGSDDGSYGTQNSFKSNQFSTSTLNGGGTFGSINSLRNSLSLSSLSMLSNWSSLPVPNLTRSMSNSREEGLRPSAFHQAMLFRLSPLSGMEGDRMNPILSFLGPEGDPSFKVILIRQAADRYHLPRVLLERLVDMRNSEGFRLVESSLTNSSRAHRASSSRPNPSASRAFMTWSLKWQTDVLLKYTVYFNPYTKQQNVHNNMSGNSGYTLGGADVRIDVVCNSDFMVKLNLDTGDGDGQKSSGEVWNKSRDVIFNNPAKQLRHFLRVLREVDHMLVQVCGLIGTPGNDRVSVTQDSPQDLPMNHPPHFGLTGGVAARCKVLGQLGVGDWHRWFQVIYFEVRAQPTSNVKKGIEKTIGVSIDTVEGDGGSLIDQNHRLDDSMNINQIPTSAMSSEAKNKVLKSEARLQLNKIMRSWCHNQNSHGRVLSPHLFLRHICASPSLNEPLSNVSDHHEHEHGHASGQHDHDFSGFCLVKLNWDVGFGGLASFHLGFFNVDVGTRFRLTEELQRTLTKGKNGNHLSSMYFEVTRRSLAAKLIDWSGLITADPMDASGRDGDITPKISQDTSGPSPSHKSQFEKNREFNRIRVNMPRSAAKLLNPVNTAPQPSPEPQAPDELASGGSLMSLTSYLRHHHWKWDISQVLANSCSGASSLMLGALCRLRQEEGFQLVSDSDRKEKIEEWESGYLLEDEDDKNTTVLGSLFLVREIEVFQFPQINTDNENDKKKESSNQSSSKYGSILLGPDSIFGGMVEEDEAVGSNAEMQNPAKPPSTKPIMKSKPVPTTKVLSVLQFRAVMMKSDDGKYTIACGLWMDPQYGSISEDEAKYLLRGLVFDDSVPTQSNANSLIDMFSQYPEQHMSAISFFHQFVKAISCSDRFCLSSMHAFLYAYSSLMGDFNKNQVSLTSPTSSSSERSDINIVNPTSHVSSKSHEKQKKQPRKSQKISQNAQYGLDISEFLVPLLDVTSLKRYAFKRLLAQRMFSINSIPIVEKEKEEEDICEELDKRKNVIDSDSEEESNIHLSEEEDKNIIINVLNNIIDQMDVKVDHVNETVEVEEENESDNIERKRQEILDMRNRRLYFLMVDQLRKNFAHAEIDLSQKCEEGEGSHRVWRQVVLNKDDNEGELEECRFMFLRLICNGSFMMVEVPPFSDWLKQGGIIETYSLTLDMIRNGMLSELKLFSQTLAPAPQEEGSNIDCTLAEKLVLECIARAHARAFCSSLFEFLRDNELLVHPDDISWALEGRIGYGNAEKVTGKTSGKTSEKTGKNNVMINASSVDYLNEVKTEVDITRLARLSFHRQYNGSWIEIIKSDDSDDSDDEINSEFWHDDEWNDALNDMFKPVVDSSSKNSQKIGSSSPVFGIADSQSIQKANNLDCLYVYNGPLEPSLFVLNKPNEPRRQGKDVHLKSPTNDVEKSPKGFVFIRNSFDDFDLDGSRQSSIASPVENEKEDNGKLRDLMQHVLNDDEPPLFVRFVCSVSAQGRSDAESIAKEDDQSCFSFHSNHTNKDITFVDDEVSIYTEDDEIPKEGDVDRSSFDTLPTFDGNGNDLINDQVDTHELNLNSKLGIATALRILVNETLEATLKENYSSFTRDEVEETLEYLQATLVVHSSVFSPSGYQTAHDAEGLDAQGKLVHVPFSSLLNKNVEEKRSENNALNLKQDWSFIEARSVVTQAAAAAAAFRKGWDETLNNTSSSNQVDNRTGLLIAVGERNMLENELPPLHRHVISWIETRISQIQALHTLRCLLGRFSSKDHMKTHNVKNLNNLKSARLTNGVVAQVQQELPFIPPQFLVGFTVKLRFVLSSTVEYEIRKALALEGGTDNIDKLMSDGYNNGKLPQCIALRLDQELRGGNFLDLRRVNDTYVLVESDKGQYLTNKTSKDLCSEARLGILNETDDVLGKCSVLFWGLIKVQSESGVLLRQHIGGVDKIDANTINSNEKCLEHSVSVQVHFPYSHGGMSLAGVDAALASKIKTGLHAAAMRVNQRLLLMDLVDTKHASPYLIPPPVMSSPIATSSTTRSTKSVSKESEDGSEIPLVNSVNFFRVGQFSCEERFRYRFQLMPRVSSTEAMTMLSRTKVLSNFVVANRPNTYAYYSTPNDERSYRTYYFTISACTSSDLKQKIDKNNSSRAMPLLSSYADASFLELYVWGLEEVCYELSVELIEVIYQNLFEHAILRLASSLSRNQTLPLDYRDILFISGAAQIETETSEPKPVLPKLVKDISDETSILLDSKEYVNDATLHAGVQKSLSQIVELPIGVSDPYLFMLLLRQFISRSGSDQAAFFMPVHTPKNVTTPTTTSTSSFTSDTSQERKSDGDFSLGLSRMPHVSKRRAQSMQISSKEFTPPDKGESSLSKDEVSENSSVYREVDGTFVEVHEGKGNNSTTSGEVDDEDGVEIDVNTDGYRFYYRYDVKGAFSNNLNPGLALLHLHLLTDMDGEVVPCERVRTCKHKISNEKELKEWVQSTAELSPEFKPWMKTSMASKHLNEENSNEDNSSSKEILSMEREDININTLSESSSVANSKENPVYFIGVVLQTSGRGEVKLEPLLEAFKVCFSETMREYLLESYLRSSPFCFNNLRVKAEDIDTNKINGSSLSLVDGDIPKIVANKSISSDDVKVAEEEDKEVEIDQGSDEIALPCLLTLVSASPESEEDDVPSTGRRRAPTNNTEFRRPVTAGATSTFKNNNIMNKEGFVKYNKILSRTTRSEVLPLWLLKPLVVDFIHNFSDVTMMSNVRREGVVSVKETAMKETLEWKDVLVFRKEWVGKEFKYIRCLTPDDMKYDEKARCSMTTKPDSFKKLQNQGEFVMVMGQEMDDQTSSKLWGDRLYSSIEDVDDVISKEISSLSSTSLTESVPKNQISKSQSNVSQCLSRRAFAILEIGHKQQNLIFYNCDEKTGSSGLVRRLKTCLDTSVAVATARRNGFLRLCIPSLPSFNNLFNSSLNSENMEVINRMPWVLSQNGIELAANSSVSEQEEEDEYGLGLMTRVSNREPVEVNRHANDLLPPLKSSLIIEPLTVIPALVDLPHMSEYSNLSNHSPYCDALASTIGVRLDLDGHVELVAGIQQELRDNSTPPPPSTLRRRNSSRTEDFIRESLRSPHGKEDLDLTQTSSLRSRAISATPAFKAISGDEGDTLKKIDNTQEMKKPRVKTPPITPPPFSSSEDVNQSTDKPSASVVFSAPAMAKPPTGITDPVQLAKIAAYNRRRGGMNRMAPTNVAHISRGKGGSKGGKGSGKGSDMIGGKGSGKGGKSDGSDKFGGKGSGKGGNKIGGKRVIGASEGSSDVRPSDSSSIESNAMDKKEIKRNDIILDQEIDGLVEEPKELMEGFGSKKQQIEEEPSEKETNNVIVTSAAAVVNTKRCVTFQLPSVETETISTEPDTSMTLSDTSEVMSPPSLLLFRPLISAVSLTAATAGAMATLDSTTPAIKVSPPKEPTIDTEPPASIPFPTLPSSLSLATSPSAFGKLNPNRVRAATAGPTDISPRKRSSSGSDDKTVVNFSRLRHRSSTTSESDGGDMFPDIFPPMKDGMSLTDMKDGVMGEKMKELTVAKKTRPLETTPMPWDRTVGLGAASILRMRVLRKNGYSSNIPRGHDILSQQACHTASELSVSLSMFSKIEKSQRIVAKWASLISKDTTNEPNNRLPLSATSEEMKNVLTRAPKEWTHVSDINLSTLSSDQSSSREGNSKPDELLFDYLDKELCNNFEGHNVNVSMKKRKHDAGDKQPNSECDDLASNIKESHVKDPLSEESSNLDATFLSSHLVHWYLIPLTKKNLIKWGFSWSELIGSNETLVVPMFDSQGQNAMQAYMNKHGKGIVESSQNTTSSATDLINHAGDVGGENDDSNESIGFLLFSVSLCSSSGGFASSISKVTHTLKTRGWCVDSGISQGYSSSALLQVGHSLDPLHAIGMKSLLTDLGLHSFKTSITMALSNRETELSHRNYCRLPFISLCSNVTDELSWAVGKSNPITPKSQSVSFNGSDQSWLCEGSICSLFTSSIDLWSKISMILNKEEDGEEEENEEENESNALMNSFNMFMRTRCSKQGRVIELPSETRLNEIGSWRWIGEIPCKLLKSIFNDCSNQKCETCQFIVEFRPEKLKQNTPLLVLSTFSTCSLNENEINQIISQKYILPSKLLYMIVNNFITTIISSFVKDFISLQSWTSFLDYHYVIKKDEKDVSVLGIVNEDGSVVYDSTLDVEQHEEEDENNSKNVSSVKKLIKTSPKFICYPRQPKQLVSIPLRKLNYDTSLSCAYSDSEEGREQYGRTPEVQHLGNKNSRYSKSSEQNSMPSMLSNPLFSPQVIYKRSSLGESLTSNTSILATMSSSSLTNISLPTANEGLLLQLLKNCPSIPLSDLHENLDLYFASDGLYDQQREERGEEHYRQSGNQSKLLRMSWGRTLEKIRTKHEARHQMGNSEGVSILLFLDNPYDEKSHPNFHMVLLPPSPKLPSQISEMVIESNVRSNVTDYSPTSDRGGNEFFSARSTSLSFDDCDSVPDLKHNENAREYTMAFEDGSDAAVMFSWNAATDLTSCTPGKIEANVICLSSLHLTNVLKAFPPNNSKFDEVSKHLRHIKKTGEKSTVIMEKEANDNDSKDNSTVFEVISEILTCFETPLSSDKELDERKNNIEGANMHNTDDEANNEIKVDNTPHECVPSRFFDSPCRGSESEQVGCVIM